MLSALYILFHFFFCQLWELGMSLILIFLEKRKRNILANVTQHVSQKTGIQIQVIRHWGPPHTPHIACTCTPWSQRFIHSGAGGSHLWRCATVGAHSRSWYFRPPGGMAGSSIQLDFLSKQQHREENHNTTRTFDSRYRTKTMVDREALSSSRGGTEFATDSWHLVTNRLLGLQACCLGSSSGAMGPWETPLSLSFPATQQRPSDCLPDRLSSTEMD